MQYLSILLSTVLSGARALLRGLINDNKKARPLADTHQRNRILDDVDDRFGRFKRTVERSRTHGEPTEHKISPITDGH